MRPDYGFNAKPLFTVLCALVLSACNVVSPDLQLPSSASDFARVVSPQNAQVADPKVNIVFVVDNSGSMKDYQTKLAQNLDLFADVFFEHQRLNYRIGVLPVYDSKFQDGTDPNRSGVPRQMNKLGRLIKLKGLPDDVDQEQYFITRDTPDKKKVLRESVQIGVQWGPEAEESFSPVLAMMDEIRNKEHNQSFYEKDAYLALIFLTDADDVSRGLSARDFYERLAAAKDDDKSKILIAAAIPDFRNPDPNCKMDGRGPIDAIPALLEESGGIRADLCSNNFGAKLAEFGGLIANVVSKQRILIGFEPDLRTLAVCYGPANANADVCGEGLAAEQVQGLQRLSRGDNGFYQDTTPGREAIVISQTALLIRVPDGRIYIRAKRVDRSQLGTDRLQEK